MSALAGERTVLARGGEGFPSALESVAQPPDRLYVVGDPFALQEGIAIVGARRATPYGRGCAKRFAALAARRGIVVVSGGARGCDAAAHAAALEEGGRTVAFLGGGSDRLYPAEHEGLFQRIVDEGGAVVSEHAWDEDPKPYRFRLRNRLIAGLARATLIVEAGLPSGTFSTADEALAANRDVLVVPGAITAVSSRGANRLIYQGATPVIDDETFEDALFSLFGCLKQETVPSVERTGAPRADEPSNPVADALRAEPLSMEQLYAIAASSCGGEDARSWLMERLVEAELAGTVARHPDGRWGPAVRCERRSAMTTLSMFYGIVIIMYNEADGRHHTPHIHARFAEFECSIDFEGRVFDGRFPPRKLALLRAWIVLHQEELEADWKLMSEGLAAFRIDPLR